MAVRGMAVWGMAVWRNGSLEEWQLGVGAVRGGGRQGWGQVGLIEALYKAGLVNDKRQC